MNVSLNFKVEIPAYMLHWIVAQRLWFHCLLNHVSEKNRKMSEALQWSEQCYEPQPQGDQ